MEGNRELSCMCLYNASCKRAQAGEPRVAALPVLKV